MNCFRHPVSPALGSCKQCAKGLCLECAADTEGGLACRGACETHVVQTEEMNARAKRIYGIGLTGPRPTPTGVLLWGLIAGSAWLVPLFNWITSRGPGLGSIVIACLATVAFFIVRESARRTQLNC